MQLNYLFDHLYFTISNISAVHISHPFILVGTSKYMHVHYNRLNVIPILYMKKYIILISATYTLHKNCTFTNSNFDIHEIKKHGERRAHSNPFQVKVSLT